MSIQTHHTLIISVALALASFACKDEPTPKPQSTVVDAGPEAAPTPAQAKVCDVTVVGERKVARAILSTKSQGVTELEVTDSRELAIDCPEDEADYEDAVIVAELEAKAGGAATVADVVHWQVDLDADPAKTELALAEAKQGYGPLDPEDLQRLQDEYDWPKDDLGPAEDDETGETGEGETGEGETGEAETGEAEAGELGHAASSHTKPHAGSKVPVTFKVGRLKWAQIEYTNTKKPRPKKLVLKSQTTLSLEPGTYELRLRYPENSTEWRPAAPILLEVGAGAKSISVEFKPGPKATIKAN